ncbi:MAG: dihydropteroate synthase [Betaproteobacteria bacterium]|nr:dihydropteroate synthase [Betaproteobacteria bacterium]
MFWQTSRYRIDLGSPRVMGIVNITPDSFTDGGHYLDASAALGRCEQLLSQGADLLDLGAESTRPGAGALQLGVPVSVDTYKPEVMQVALDMGADIINDIWALRWLDPEPSVAALSGLAVVAAHPNCGVCLMHMHREPQTMQVSPMEGEVLAQVLSFLSQRALALTQRGVAKARIVLDPGIGFGKTAEQNFSLLAQQQTLLNGGYPLLAGWSRKRSLASSLDLPSAAGTDMPHPRMVASVAAALLAVERGAAIVRVHDVRETVQALKVLSAIK